MTAPLFTPARLLGASVALGLSALALHRLAPGQVPAGVLGLLAGAAAGLLLGAVLRWQLPEACDMSTPALRRRYVRELMSAMAAYAGALVLSLWLLKQVSGPTWLRGLIAVLPVPLIALALRAIVRYIRDADEMQRRIELEAVSIAAAFVSLLYLTGGFLQVAQVIHVPGGAAMIWVFPSLCFAYGLAKAAIARRYR